MVVLQFGHHIIQHMETGYSIPKLVPAIPPYILVGIFNPR